MAAPIREQLRDQRLAISVLVEQIMNGQQSDASTQIGTIITTLQTIQTAVNAATDATITTL
jgi:hypothetical protein